MDAHRYYITYPIGFYQALQFICGVMHPIEMYSDCSIDCEIASSFHRQKCVYQSFWPRNMNICQCVCGFPLLTYGAFNTMRKGNFGYGSIKKAWEILSLHIQWDTSCIYCIISFQQVKAFVYVVYIKKWYLRNNPTRCFFSFSFNLSLCFTHSTLSSLTSTSSPRLSLSPCLQYVCIISSFSPLSAAI